MSAELLKKQQNARFVHPTSSPFLHLEIVDCKFFPRPISGGLLPPTRTNRLVALCCDVLYNRGPNQIPATLARPNLPLLTCHPNLITYGDSTLLVCRTSQDYKCGGRTFPIFHVSEARLQLVQGQARVTCQTTNNSMILVLYW